MNRQAWRHRRVILYYVALVALRVLTGCVSAVLVGVAKVFDTLDDLVIAAVNHQARRLKTERELATFGYSAHDDIDSSTEGS